MSMQNQNKTSCISCATVAALFPDGLLEKLAVIHSEQGGKVYITGGTVRDLLLGRQPSDIDLTVIRKAKQWAERLVELTGGTYVELGREQDAARVVWQGEDVDFSSFRQGASSIEQELHKRDITVNSLALPVHDLFYNPDCAGLKDLPVIDSVGGIADLDQRLIRVTSPTSFHDDPLRMLRVFRFAAVLDFTIDPDTLAQVCRHKQEIERISRERITYELDVIMGSNRAWRSFVQMRECGLLWEILPELRAGVGMNQPASHHLDVFDHCLEALRWMEKTLADPGHYFPANRELIEEYLRTDRRRLQMKWAALFHDMGKPATFGINEDKGGRITFYNHDLQGAEIFTRLARRLRWPREDTSLVSGLITSHMRPFFLANNQRQGNLTLKACLRLVKTIGEHLPGLFLVAMADALAGKGEASPEEIEQEVAGLLERLQQVEQENVAPVRTAAPMISGKDLINHLHLTPSPQFRKILEQVEDAYMEQSITTREQGLVLAESIVKNQDSTHA